eukprot:6207269-Pleurochrysis_carterae.AAC.1
MRALARPLARSAVWSAAPCAALSSPDSGILHSLFYFLPESVRIKTRCIGHAYPYFPFIRSNFTLIRTPAARRYVIAAFWRRGLAGMIAIFVAIKYNQLQAWFNWALTCQISAVQAGAAGCKRAFTQPPSH